MEDPTDEVSPEAEGKWWSEVHVTRFCYRSHFFSLSPTNNTTLCFVVVRIKQSCHLCICPPHFFLLSLLPCCLMHCVAGLFRIFFDLYACMRSTNSREKATEILFETLTTPAMHMALQPVLALYACGPSSGLIVDIGDSGTQVNSDERMIGEE